MKRLIMILMAFVTIHATAQEQNSELQQQRQRTHATPEEVAQIQTQRMSKSLELSEAQQKEVYDLLLQRNKMRQTKKEAFNRSKEKLKRKWHF